MATATMKQTADTIDYVSASPIAANTIVRIARFIAVIIRAFTQADIDAGRKASAVISGAFTFPKKTGVTILQGESLFWSDSEANLSNVSSGRWFAGFAIDGAGSSVALVDVRLQAMDS